MPGSRRLAAQAAPSTLPAAISAVDTPGGRSLFRRRLLAWYRRHARRLPWRVSRDPYRVWVSEIMLQQTQVATVEAYFPRFLRAFPTLSSLAQASEEQVLRQWEGLGYYRRARQMHRAARQVVADHGAEFPRDRDSVRGLPGIGRYTAGAILSIAFDLPEPILEANTVRLWSRLLALGEDPTRASAQRILWQAAEAVLPRRGAGNVNQALMELGSQVCRPRQPDCHACPLSSLCTTFERGWQDEIPVQPARPRIESVREVTVAIRRRELILVVRRADTERWAGMWDFPRFALETGQAGSDADIETRIREFTGLDVRLDSRLATFKHGVTRYRITLDCYLARCASGRARGQTFVESRWVRPAELTELPLSVTARKFSKLIAEATSERPVRGSAARRKK